MDPASLKGRRWLEAHVRMKALDAAQVIVTSPGDMGGGQCDGGIAQQHL
jgi:hypothetical protein